jgi:hypothetical protein
VRLSKVTSVSLIPCSYEWEHLKCGNFSKKFHSAGYGEGQDWLQHKQTPRDVGWVSTEIGPSKPRGKKLLETQGKKLEGGTDCVLLELKMNIWRKKMLRIWEKRKVILTPWRSRRFIIMFTRACHFSLSRAR